MEKLSVRQLPVVGRHLREPVVVTYSFPRNSPRYGQESEIGFFFPWDEHTAAHMDRVAASLRDEGALDRHIANGGSPADDAKFAQREIEEDLFAEPRT